MTRTGALLLSCLAASSALAQTPMPAVKPAAGAAGVQAPKPGEMPGAGPTAGGSQVSTRLDRVFRFFRGAWKCDSRFAAGAMGPGSPEMTAKSTVRFRKDLDGFFYRADYEMEKGETTPGFRGTLYLTHQPAAGLFTMTSIDSTGGVEFVTSPGFQGDTITFTGEAYMMGEKIAVRDSMTKRGPKEFGHRVEIDRGKGFELMGEDVCSR